VKVNARASDVVGSKVDEGRLAWISDTRLCCVIPPGRSLSLDENRGVADGDSEIGSAFVVSKKRDICLFNFLISSLQEHPTRFSRGRYFEDE